MLNRLNRFWAITIAVLLIIGVYFVPPVHDRLAPRLDSLRTQIKYFINPPEDAVFQPAQQAAVETIVSGTLTPQAAVPTSTQTLAPTVGPTSPRRSRLRLCLPPLN